jgi:hypothetical protein
MPDTNRRPPADRDLPDRLLVLSSDDVEHVAARLAMDVDDESPEWYNAGYVDAVHDMTHLLIDGEIPGR